MQDHKTNQCRPHVCSVIPSHILKKIVENGGETQRSQAMRTMAMSARLRGRRDILGAVFNHKELVVATGEKRRTVFDAKTTDQLPGALVLSEGGAASNDVCVTEAYEGAGATYDMYESAFKRTSVDGRGLRLDSTVHYSVGYDNAFWDGRQMVYGDGDGKIFNRFTAAVDVIGHELTHGVTQYTCNLDYYGQPGALNESMSDCFGSMVKQFKSKQTFKDADWLIGAGLFTQHVRGVAIRSMKLPGEAYDDPIIGKDPQPGHMKNYVRTEEDEEGVHINSGIMNHMFYLVCEILAESPAAGEADIRSWKTPGQIWYGTLQKLRHTSDFAAFASTATQVAADLFGARSKEQNAIKKAAAGVGITIK